jgi:hypothetical protein
MSLGASQQLGKSLVFFNWKGLDVVREYVIPTNPNTTSQQTQRNFLKAALTAIHGAMSHPVFPLGLVDKSAYALWASIEATPRTWFNEAVKNYVDQGVAGLNGQVYCGGAIVEAADEVDIDIYNYTGDVTAGYFWYGTSKTALLNSKVATVAGQKLSADLTGLTTGVKYYIQFRPTAPAGQVGAYSGIYHGTPL